MSISRRKFLGLAGLGAVAATAKVVVAGNEPAETRTVRLAMAIDVQKCMEKPDCNLCSAACHRAHNIPTIHEREHEVKWIWKERFENVFPSQHSLAAGQLAGKSIPVLCNHCDNPPCARVCPTKATWKRSDGVVMMDWHRCIGCRYCVAACPYGSRSFNWSDPRPHIEAMTADYPTRTKGVVEKCTMCEERLAAGKKPACVEACPQKAMHFGDMNDPRSEIRRVLAEGFAIQRRPELGTGPQIFYLV